MRPFRALLRHTVYPWPQRPAGLVEAGFKELARRWKPILDAFDEAGVDLCYEIRTPAKTFTTALLSSVSGLKPAITRAAASCTTFVALRIAAIRLSPVH